MLNFPTVSRQHAAVQRDENGLWTIYSLGGKGGVTVNDKPVKYQKAITVGDKVSVAASRFTFSPPASRNCAARANSAGGPAAASVPP